MPGLFDWAMSLTGQEPNGNPYDQIGALSDQMQGRNRAAVGLDANGNPLPQGAQGGAAPAPGGAATPTALASTGVMQPQQEPNATKTPASMGHLLADLTQYQEREQGFNQALGGMGAAISQPRDRDWVRGLFNVNQVDPLKFTQQEMDMASQQQGQDRANSVGMIANDPDRVAALAKSLNMDPVQVQTILRGDPKGAMDLIRAAGTPTATMANLQQIERYIGNVQQTKPNTSPQALQLIRNAMLAGASGPDAEKAVGDAMSYQSSHNGKTAPWVTGNGVNLTAYNQWSKEQGDISSSQTAAASTLPGSIAKTEMLRQKVSDLQNNPGLNKILSLPNDSPMKQAAWNAVNDQDPNWQKNVAYSALISDPQVMQAISELKEINGQEYTGAIDSLLGHGLRPSQTEVTAVREGFGQTKNLLNFGSMKDYTAQAINPMLTRLDEAEGTGYGAAGDLKSIPARVQPFVHPTYLTGGKMHLDDGAAPTDWEGNVNKPLPPDLAAAAQAKIAQQPGNAFAIRDGLRRKGYVVNF